MEQPKSPPLFTFVQKIIVLVLTCTLVLGLLVVKHRRAASATPVTITPGTSEAYALKVDINTASWQEISLIPGVGESKAKAIVADRDKNGPFKSLSDLSRVPGIGDKTIQEMSPYVRTQQAK